MGKIDTTERTVMASQKHVTCHYSSLCDPLFDGESNAS